MTEIVLLEDIPNLGHIGDIVRVRPGYARNYLIPRNKALLASTHNVKALEHQKRVAAKKLEKARGSADQVKDAIERLELTFAQKVGEQGKLFGSVTNIMIAEALREHNIVVERQNIKTDPIRAVGSFKVPVRLHRDVTATARVLVVSDAEEPAEQEAAQSAPEAEQSAE